MILVIFGLYRSSREGEIFDNRMGERDSRKGRVFFETANAGIFYGTVNMQMRDSWAMILEEENAQMSECENKRRLDCIVKCTEKECS